MSRSHPRSRSGSGRDFRKKLLAAVIFQDQLGVVVMDLRVIAQDFIISAAQNLFLLAAQLVADELLHLGIIQIALSGDIFSRELNDLISARLMVLRVDGSNDFTI